ncbi:MAG: acyltransferase family protein [Tardiphaga sp.]
MRRGRDHDRDCARKSPGLMTHPRLAHIDGLRAIAVALVLWFHAQLPGLPGGYLGVDIFFVISGFLITGQIYDGIQAGSFSLPEFYARRTLRLAPPLLLVLAATLAAIGTLPLLPVDIRRIGESVLASAVMLPNWYFLRHADYFAPDAEREPLLHLWSLGVEEQYYLFVPLVVLGLALIARRRSVNLYSLGLICTAAVLILSFVAAAALLHARPASVFFATPLRVWEFAVGGLAVLALRRGFALTDRMARSAMLAGLLAIVAACSVTAVAPSQRLLLQAVVALGAGAVLLGGACAQRGAAMRLLSLRPMVALGLVSYALYLWHWPVLSFWRLTHLDATSPVENVIAGIAIPLVLAIASYILVERPLQRWRRHRGAGLPQWRSLAAGTAAAVLVSCSALATMAWSTRLDATEPYRAFAEADAGILPACGMGLDQLAANCRLGRGADDRVLLLGDSHAMSLARAVAASADAAGQSGRLVWQGHCPMLPGNVLYTANDVWPECMAHNDAVLGALSSTRLGNVTGVILAAAWGLHFGHAAPEQDRAGRVNALRDAAQRSVARFRALGLRVLLVGPVPIMPRAVPGCLFLARSDAEQRSCRTTRAETDAMEDDIVAALRFAASGDDNVRFIDVRPAFCDSDTCWPARRGEIYYRDNSHLSPAGNRLIHDRFKGDLAWVFATRSRDGQFVTQQQP